MRNICYQILRDFEQNNIYLNLALKNIDNTKYPINQIAIRVYGVVQNYELLQYLSNELVEKRKVDKKINLILMMQIYEYRFLNKDIHVICDEGVKLANKYANHASGFVNANLRQVNKIKTIEPTFANVEKNISIKYSHPRFITKKLIKQYPDDHLQILASNCEKKTTFVRKVGTGDLDDNFEIVKPFNDLYIYKGKQIVQNDSFLKNEIIIQDLGSYLVGVLVNANNNQTVLDLCAAPGNKTIQISKSAKHVVANDLHKHRTELIKDNIKKYNIENIDIINVDATNLENVKNGLVSSKNPLIFDKILIDAPCSGWGVIKSKPEIKYNHSSDDIDEVLKTSQSIIETSLNFLAPDGELIFSTCTLNRDENDNLINFICSEYNLKEVKNEFLNEFTKNDFEHGICLKNYVYNSDSFYMIKLVKDE